MNGHLVTITGSEYSLLALLSKVLLGLSPHPAPTPAAVKILKAIQNHSVGVPH